MRIEMFDSESFCGYTQITSFYQDFSIADKFGIDAIKDTYDRAFAEWKSNYQYLTELVLVLNWKCWRWYEKNNDFCKLYEELYYEARDYALDNLKGSELDYYLKITN